MLIRIRASCSPFRVPVPGHTCAWPLITTLFLTTEDDAGLVTALRDSLQAYYGDMALGSGLSSMQGVCVPTATTLANSVSHGPWHSSPKGAQGCHMARVVAAQSRYGCVQPGREGSRRWQEFCTAGESHSKGWPLSSSLVDPCHHFVTSAAALQSSTTAIRGGWPLCVATEMHQPRRVCAGLKGGDIHGFSKEPRQKPFAVFLAAALSYNLALKNEPLPLPCRRSCMR